MIIKFSGEFSKEELAEAIFNFLDTPSMEKFKFKGSLYLTTVDELGREDQSPKQSTIRSKKKDRVPPTEVPEIRKLRDENVSIRDISEQLGITRRAVASVSKAIAENIKIFQKKDLNDYMFLASEIKSIDKSISNVAEVVGVCKGSRSYENVYSFQKFCERTDIPILTSLSGTNYVNMEAFKRSSFDQVYHDKKWLGALWRINNEIRSCVDLCKFAEEENLLYFKDANSLPPGFGFAEDVIGIKQEKFVNEPVGVALVGPSHNSFREVYDIKALYDKYQIKLISNKEIKEHTHKTIFKKVGVSNYVPKEFGSDDLFEIYGFDSYGRVYLKTRLDLRDFFGLIRRDSLQEGDVRIPLKYMIKFRTLIRDHGFSLSDVLPDGMTEDYDFVFLQGKLDASVAQAIKAYVQFKEHEQLTKS